MKVSQLITLLQEMPQDLTVYGYCDHGQTPEICTFPTIGYAEDDEYSLQDWSSDVEEAEENGHTQQFVIL